jgi:hypothetical protein
VRWCVVHTRMSSADKMDSSAASILLAKQARGGNCRGNLTRLWLSEVAILAAALSCFNNNNVVQGRTQQAQIKASKGLIVDKKLRMAFSSSKADIFLFAITIRYTTCSKP